MFTWKKIWKIYYEYYSATYEGNAFHNVYVFADDLEDFIGFKKQKWQALVEDFQPGSRIDCGLIGMGQFQSSIISELFQTMQTFRGLM